MCQDHFSRNHIFAFIICYILGVYYLVCGASLFFFFDFWLLPPKFSFSQIDEINLFVYGILFFVEDILCT
jgi:hypothetical protein